MRYLWLLWLLVGCDVDEGFLEGGDPTGATPGGAQDIGYVREIIAQGGVPSASDWLVEGLLSEHDLPLGGPPCEDLLCVRPGLGRAPDPVTGEPVHWLQLGLASGVTDFERPPLDLVMLVDTSEGMSIDMVETNEAVSRLVGHLDARDRLAIVSFNDRVEVIHPLGPVQDEAALVGRVRQLEAGGGWDFEPAFDDAIDAFVGAPEPGRMRRIVVLSCAWPDPTTLGPALALAGDLGIGVSFFGVLLGHDPAIARLLGGTRGGAYGYLNDLEAVVRVFDEDFDFLMTPLAYDLTLTLELAPGWAVDRVFGLPDDPAAEGVDLSVKTVFFSRRKGAVLVRLQGEGAPGRLDFSYTPNPALGGAPADERVDLVVPEGEVAFAHAGVRKGALLVNLSEGAAHVCALWHEGRRDEARGALERLITYVTAEIAVLEDEALAPELALLETLRRNLRP